MLKKPKAVIISFIAGCLAAGGISWWQCSFLLEEYPGRAGIFMGISNGCFAAAVIYLSLSLLGIVGNMGAFNGLRYFGRVIRAKFARNESDRIIDSYYDFVRKLEEKGKLSLNFLIIPGIIYLAASAVFTLLFMNV